MARLTRAAALCALMAALTFGCSDSGDGGPPSPQEFVAAAVVAECDDFGACCALDEHPFDESFCRARTDAFLQARIANPAVLYDGEAAARCLDALRASPDQCDVTAQEVEACGAVFRGTKPPGTACTDPAECAGYPDDGYCTLASPSAPPVCATFPPPPNFAGAGEPCTGTCREDSRSTLCTYFGSASESSPVCSNADGLFCDPTTATCAALLAPGSACDRAAPLGCPVGTYCDGTSCVPSRGDGESCLVDSCQPQFSCPSPSDEACVEPLVCPFDFENARCTLPRPDGSPCTEPRECESLWCEQDCSSGQCAPGSCARPERTDPEFCAGTIDDVAALGADVETRPGVQTRSSVGAQPAPRVRPVLRWLDANARR